MAMLLFKTTLLFVLTLGCLPLMRRTSSAVRHLVCFCALAGALLLPLTTLAPPQATPIHVSAITFLAESAAAPNGAARPILKVFDGLWITGIVLLLLRLAIGYGRLGLVLRTATPADGSSFLTDSTEDAVLLHRLDSLRTASAFSDVSVPLVTGLLRPVILMPRSFLTWPHPQRAAALRHELAHIERRDLWTSLIAELACAVYWFHPLVWAIAHRQRREQESACDDAVLCSGFTPDSYAEALIATARQINTTRLIGCHMTQRTLKDRIARLFENGMPRMSSPAMLRRIATGVVAVAGVVALLNGNQHVRAAVEQATAASPATPGTDSPAATAPTVAVHKPAVADRAEQPPADTEVQPGRVDRVYKMSDGIVPPRLLEHVDPSYTDEAKAAKISGTVSLSLVVGTDGLAHDIAVVNGIDPGLDVKAIEAIQTWRFQPGTKDGEPVAVQASIEVNFKLL